MSREAADRALPGLVDALAAAGLLDVSGGEVRALVDVRPYADDDRGWWVVSDLTPGLDGAPIDVGADHVLGISSASSSLAQLTVREPFARALDLGTGCGVQALHLAEHVEHDRRHRRQRAGAGDDPAERRAQRGARSTSARAACSSPSPASGSTWSSPTRRSWSRRPPTRRLVYRDSGLPGDEVVRRVVTQAPAHLNPGGWAQVLANWVHRRGEPWQDRVGRLARRAAAATPGWCSARSPTSRSTSSCGSRTPACTAAPTTPGGTTPGWRGSTSRTSRPWASGGCTCAHGSTRAARRCCTWRSGRSRSSSRSAPRSPSGPGVPTSWRPPTTRRCSRAGSPVRVDVRQETVGEVGAADPETIVLRQQRGMRRARQADTVEAGLVGACDGDLTVGQILDALATLLDEDAGGAAAGPAGGRPRARGGRVPADPGVRGGCRRLTQALPCHREHVSEGA